MSARIPLTARVYVAGHCGLVGSAILRALQQRGFEHLIVASRAEVDLRDQAAVRRFFEANRPEYVYLTAAKVGGILAMTTFLQISSTTIS